MGKKEKIITICENCEYLQKKLDALKEPKKQKTPEELEQKQARKEEAKQKKQEEKAKQDALQQELEELRLLNRDLQKKIISN